MGVYLAFAAVTCKSIAKFEESLAYLRQARGAILAPLVLDAAKNDFEQEIREAVLLKCEPATRHVAASEGASLLLRQSKRIRKLRS
jgi:hypothetical protein